jgi:histidinol dehydrogenase
MLKVIEYDGNLKEIAQKLNNRKEEISIEVNNAVNDIINDIRKIVDDALDHFGDYEEDVVMSKI